MAPLQKTDDSAERNHEDVWNFAIGSNLHPKKLKGRANLTIKELQPGKLYTTCDLQLKRKPFVPTVDDLHKNGRNFPPNFLHQKLL